MQMMDGNTSRGPFAALALAATLVCGAWSASAATVEVTLDFGTTPGAADNPYIEDGFEVLGGGDFPGMTFSPFGNPAISAFLDIQPSILTVTRVGGGAFSLISFDYACSGGVCDFKVGDTAITGGSSSSSDFVTATLSGFTDITSLQFTKISSSHRIDNIVLSYDPTTPIPLPAGLPLLLGGLAGLGLMARRNAKLA